MATLIKYQRYYYYKFLSISFSLIIFHFHTLLAEPISSFSLKNFNDNKALNFDSSFSLLGDAQISNEGNFVNLTSSLSGSTSSGQIIYKKPFKFLDPRSSKPIISFSTDFTFTITPGNGDGLALVIFQSVNDFSKVFDQGYFGVSNNFDKDFIAIEFDTHKDDNVSDMNDNHVGVDLGTFVSSDTIDVSSIGLTLNEGKPLKTWIDYEASSKRLEVRLGEYDSEKPYQPLISSMVDLSKIWGNKYVLIGISSSNGNSMQMSSLLSWSFSLRSVSSSMHSNPLNPRGSSVDDKDQSSVREKSYFLYVLGTLIFATGCGTLVAFVALFFWVVFCGRHSNVAPELPMNSIDFKYEKVNVTIDNTTSDDATS